MRINANAKVNLCLDVTGKLPDGYHSVSMIMQEVSLADIVDIEVNSSGEIKLTIEGMELPTDEKNIAYKAAQLFFNETESGMGCDIYIQKNIPSCAGLGGGSADGAAVLKCLNDICNNPLSNDELLGLGLKLGADVPFCIMGGTAHAAGIGEVLTPLKSRMEGYVSIIKPKINISTPRAYKDLDSCIYPHPDMIKCIDAVECGDISALRDNSANVFEYVCCPLHKEIDEIKTHLLSYGAEFAMMSGSGSAVFGLFDTGLNAKKAFESYTGSFDGGGVCKIIK